MKKITVLLLLATMFAYNTKAQETKQQFVKWETVPSPSDVKVAWLKSAMKGESIPGASVRSTAATYKAVWGDDLYSKVLNADDSRFSLYRSKGGEVNWAVGANGAAVQSGTLDENVWVVTLDGQEIAKWGKNGCLNALSAPSYTADGDDPDNKKPGSKPSPNNGSMSMTNGSNSITFTGNPGGTNQQELSWNNGYAVYSLGRNDRQSDFIVDASLYKMIQDAKQCCGGGSSIAAAATVSYAAPTVYAQPSIATAAPAQTIMYQQAAQKVPFGQTFGGQLLANTIGTAGGVLIAGAIQGNGNRNIGYSNTQQWSGGYFPNTQPFQGSSILGQTFTGGITTNLNSIGQTYTAQQINTSNGNGTWNNTQIF